MVCFKDVRCPLTLYIGKNNTEEMCVVGWVYMNGANFGKVVIPPGGERRTTR
jgi:hypothetical protein